jgi:hypothetical protein
MWQKKLSFEGAFNHRDFCTKRMTVRISVGESDLCAQRSAEELLPLDLKKVKRLLQYARSQRSTMNGVRL